MTEKEYLTGEKAEAHAKAFAEELKALMAKYDAQLDVDVVGDAYARMFFNFSWCDKNVQVGTWTDGTELEVR